jgi:hypothetical protein
MLTLTRATHATLIHGTTGQEIHDTVLPAGTEYTIESVRDGRVARWVTILVPESGADSENGWMRYRLLETELS